MKTLSKFLTLFVLLGFATTPFVSFAQTDAELIAGGERILNFRSDILINTDGSMLVKETIKVVATNDHINHGIYRDFPTKYKDDFGNAHTVRFDVIRATRDGASEEFHTENKSNGKRVYLGNADIVVDPGVHTYELSYRTDRQIGFFADHDELYWNVTGNGWAFAIDSAEAHIKLPTQADTERVMKIAAYTGGTGSKATNFRSDTKDASINFYTTSALGSYEGLTVAVGFPKGIVKEPTKTDNLIIFFKDNIFYLVGLIIIIAVARYYFLAWKKVGKDPKPQAIIPHYEAPRGLSPAQVRFIHKMKYDRKAMVAAIISMGVKGHLKVEELKKNYRLVALGKHEDRLSVEEASLSKNMFSATDTFEIKQDNYKKVAEAYATIDKALKDMFKEKYFIKNVKHMVKGISISVFGVFILIMGGNPVALIVYLLIIIPLNIIFIILLPSRTIEGRKLEDEIEGFKWFLSVTEKDRMNFHNPPEKTPELFEKFLPYALALGVENKWAEQFHDVFNKINGEEGGYHPAWFVGHSLNAHSLAAFTSDMSSSMNSAIASSSVAPGSSSGFSGGSSGGGGGGGGGGGW